MRQFTTYLILTAASLAICSSGFAAPFVIDDFDDDQGPLVGTGGFQDSTGPAPNTAFGTTRELFVEGPSTVTAEVANGTFRGVSTDDQVGATFGFALPTLFDTGPASIDLTGGGTNDAVFIDLIEAQNLVGDSFQVAIETTSSGSFFSVDLGGPVAAPQTVTVSFNELLANNPDLDLTQVTSIGLLESYNSSVARPGIATFEVDAIRVGVIPEPSSGLLLLAVLGTLSVRRRREVEIPD